MLEFILSFLLTGKVMTVMENYATPVQAIEPFLWTFGDGTAVLLSSLLLLLLFSDLPKMTPVTPYQLVRTTKKKWLWGQLVYCLIYCPYAFFHLCIVYEKQLSRQSVE